MKFLTAAKVVTSALAHSILAWVVCFIVTAIAVPILTTQGANVWLLVLALYATLWMGYLSGYVRDRPGRQAATPPPRGEHDHP